MTIAQRFNAGSAGYVASPEQQFSCLVGASPVRAASGNIRLGAHGDAPTVPAKRELLVLKGRSNLVPNTSLSRYPDSTVPSGPREIGFPRR